MHGARQVDGIVSRLPELERLGVAVVLIGHDRPDRLAPFVRGLGLARPGLTVVTDPSRAAFRAANLGRPRWLGLRAGLEALRELGAGYRPRRAAADRRQLGGACLVDGQGRVVYHRASHSPGDLIDPGDLVHAALALLVDARAAGRRV
jgi:alkyl-hydroperoxide reductase/thiol specific antioxidant family protein